MQSFAVSKNDAVATPYYPAAVATLLAYSDSPFVLSGRVALALRRAGVSDASVNEYMDQALMGDLNHLLRVTCDWVTVA